MPNRGWVRSQADRLRRPRRGIEPSDIIHAITSAAALDGEAVRNVRMLQRFAFVEVPAADAERVVEQAGGTDVRGHELRFELARA